MKTIEGDQGISEQAKKNWSALFIHKLPDLGKFLRNNDSALKRISSKNKLESQVENPLKKGLGSDNHLEEKNS